MSTSVLARQPNPLPNPFRPGNGVPPPYLAGRDQLLVAFEDWLIEQPPLYANLTLIGLRGTGKTVLLGEFATRAERAGRMAGHSGDRVSAMELRDRAEDLPNVNELLRRLVVRGLLYRPTRGSYRFALPLFGRYLRRHHEITKITGPVISGQRPRPHAARRRR